MIFGWENYLWSPRFALKISWTIEYLVTETAKAQAGQPNLFLVSDMTSASIINTGYSIENPQSIRQTSGFFRTAVFHRLTGIPPPLNWKGLSIHWKPGNDSCFMSCFIYAWLDTPVNTSQQRYVSRVRGRVNSCEWRHSALLHEDSARGDGDGQESNLRWTIKDSVIQVFLRPFKAENRTVWQKLSQFGVYHYYYWATI